MWKKNRSYHIMWWIFPRKLGFIFSVIVLSAVLSIIMRDDAAIPVMADGMAMGVRASDWTIVPPPKESLLRGLPSVAMGVRASNGWQEEAQAWLYETLFFCTGVCPSDWTSLLALEFPQRASEGKRSREERGAVAEPIFAAKGSGAVRVGVYHTHTAESFIPSSGKAHAPGGQCGEIVEVGSFLVECLAKQGIKGVQSSVVHDYPNFMHAYSASEKTAQEMVAQYPTLDMIFDIHRDASKRGDASVTIDGKVCAKVLIIVAQGQEGLAQPHWQENYRLAKSLEQKMEEVYPGLSGGIQLTEWRYNQHLHHHALLLEIGSHETSKGEAMRSAKMMADVIARLLKG